MKSVARRRGTFLSAVLALIALSIGVPEAHAEKRVFSSPLDDPADLAEAQALLRPYLGRNNPHLDAHVYNPEKPPVRTFEDYVRVYIRIGRGDINDDGVEKLFYFTTNRGYCGSAGCDTWIFEKRAGTWKLICATSADQDITITNWVSEGGYRELQWRYFVYWRNGKCYEDEPRTPETKDFPPRGERTWKPMR
jgi:hypothetical protein